MSKDNLIIETFSELTPRYESVMDSELNRFWGWRYNDFVDHLIDLTPIKPDDNILDIATGTTVIPRKIKDQITSNKPIHGLDITLAMLKRAKKIIASNYSPEDFCLVCASALAMPYKNQVFDVVLCGLATHHMDARVLLSEMERILQDHGKLAIADVGGSPMWNFPGIKFLVKLLTFIYFATQENVTRAWAEATAVSNIRLVDEWYDMLVEFGFKDISITRLRSKFFWIPKPMLIRASKNFFGGENGSNE
jgi:ubiquinone/menaquinone biosynthesis C-methylase UbiE